MKFKEVEKSQQRYLQEVLGLDHFIRPEKIEDLDQSLAEEYFDGNFILVVEDKPTLAQQQLLQKILTACNWPEDSIQWIGEQNHISEQRIENCYIFSFSEMYLGQLEDGVHQVGSNTVLKASKLSSYEASAPAKKQLWVAMKLFMEKFSGSMP